MREITYYLMIANLSMDGYEGRARYWNQIILHHTIINLSLYDANQEK